MAATDPTTVSRACDGALAWVFAVARAAVLAAVTLWGIAGPVAARAADDAANATSAANRQFIQAMQLIRKADSTYDAAAEARLLREADRLLADVVTRFPDTDLAVQLITNQFVGDFDYFEFQTRVKGLVCSQPLSSACLLFRIAGLLPPIETPITTARWDWLSLAVAYHRLGDPTRAQEIIAPFLAAVRRSVPPEGTERDLFVARALALTNQIPLALELARQIPDCSTRIYDLTDIAEAALWQGDKQQASDLAEEARSYAAAKNCTWELGLVSQALYDTGREADARTLFLNTIEQQFSKFKESKGDCCPPELAVAAADLGDTNLALSLLRAVQDENPWTIGAVLGRLARRGEIGVVVAYAEQIADLDVRGEAFAELIEAFLGRNDRANAEDIMKQLVKLAGDATGRRPALLAQRAKAEKLIYSGDRWRKTFQQAVTAAESSSSFVRRDIGGPLLAALVRIETGLPLLD
ncbi:MAG: hypothetical protein GC191_03525 [Azospirillum sp.]|nr:hypothetical protein [Azospirillum sp.]